MAYVLNAVTQHEAARAIVCLCLLCSWTLVWENIYSTESPKRCQW